MTLTRPQPVILPVLIGVALQFSSIAMAQDATAPEVLVGDPDRGKIVFQKTGVCLNCHGWAGDGKTGRNPLARAGGANLRETKLDLEGLSEVIRCGVPGTSMPYHEAAAYQDDRCYGMVKADFEEGMHPVRGKTFREQQLADLIAYMQVHVIGLGKPTYEECVAFFEAAADKACAVMKSQ